MKENKYLEFKREVTNTLLKTVSAFANFGTGEILIGVDDEGAPCGLKNTNQECLNLENMINDSIQPKPEYSFSIDSKTNVITLKVLEGSDKPYFYKGKAYRRSDTASVPVDSLELRRLALEGSNLDYEEIPCPKQNLKFDYLEKKIQKILGIEKVTDDVLRTLGLADKDGKYNIAAGLLADENPFCGIDIARFGNSINIITDRETYAGISVLEQYDRAVELFEKYYQYDLIEGAFRNTIETVPETAFREAIANALIHRTWDVNAHINVSMFPDRIEITSIGGLPKGLTQEEYLFKNISIPRNPLICNVFFRLHYIEKFGTGVKRINDAYKNYTNKPMFHITDTSISITLPLISTVYQVTTNGLKVMEVLNYGGILSGKEIAEKLGWSKDKTIREINKLKDEAYIETHGNGRSSRYSKR